VLMVALGLVAGIVPAVQAMRLRIAEALRRE
jgi:ABC-type lipoprotein release transport system permease subunit